MICCLNPHCLQGNPLCPDGTKFCSGCGTKLLLLSGRYRPIKRLGEGGFGVTYLAEDNNRFSKSCVIKQLTLRLPDAQRLFEGEARRLEELADYSAIPRLLSYYSDTNYLYLVQEFVAGQDLSKELREKGIFDEVAIKDFLNAILPILDVIHNQGIIHRDIKLDNIMRRSDGKIVLIDFGIAKLIPENNTVTPGTRAGTNGYAAPEQMKEGIATPASDLYSLGAACFHLLTNLSPGNMFMDYGYQWTTNWQRHLKQPIDQKLDVVIDKLLKPNYQNRYQSAQEVIKSLDSQVLQSATTSISSGSNVLEKYQRKLPIAMILTLWAFAAIGAFFVVIMSTIFYGVLSTNKIIEDGDALLNTDKAGAIKKYTEAIEIDSKSDTAYARRANAMFILGKKQDAIKDYTKAIEINSSFSDYYNERGNILFSMDDKKGSIKDYNLAIKYDSTSPLAFSNRGNSKYHLGDKKSALEDYNKAIKLKIDFPEPYHGRGAIEDDFGDKKSALKDYTKAMTLYEKEGRDKNNDEDYKNVIKAISDIKNTKK